MFKLLNSTIWLAIGFALCGFFIGTGFEKFKTKDNTILVKGLAEQDAEANFAIWTIKFQVINPSFSKAQDEFNQALQKIKVFLANNQIPENQITLEPIDVSYEPYANEAQYKIKGRFTIHSEDLVKISQAAQQSHNLLKENIILESFEGAPNPRYIIKNFDEMRPQLLKQAKESAFNLARQLLENSGRDLGDLRHLDQGSIQVHSPNGDFEEKSIKKKLRVISYYTFNLR